MLLVAAAAAQNSQTVETKQQTSATVALVKVEGDLRVEGRAEVTHLDKGGRERVRESERERERE